MDRACVTIAWLLVAVLSGCAQTSPLRDVDPTQPTVEMDPPLPAQSSPSVFDAAAKSVPPAAEKPVAAATKSQPSAPARPTPEVKEIRSESLTEIMAELETLGGLDPASQQQLMADLKQTDPALWPQLLEAFRASVAYRRRAQEQLAAAQAAPKAPAYDQVVVCDTRPGEVKVQSAELAAPVPPKAVSPPTPAETVVSASAAAPAAALAPAPAPAAPAPIHPPATPVATQAPMATAAPDAAPAPVAAPAAPATPLVDDRDWQQHLTLAIDRLEQENSQTPTNAAEISRHAALRMLYLVDGRRENALRPIEGIPPGQQDFWSKQLYGLSAFLDTERNTDSGRRAAEATMHFRDATAKLAELATLSVKSLAFCTEVSSYGVYKAFDKHEFQPGQEVLLYAEVENFKSESSEKGYRTSLRSSYQILDPHGARVAQQEFALTEEYCRNPRRDFFIRYFVWMPKRIYGGKYTLQLTIEDTLSQKIGQSTIDFEIKEPVGGPQ